MTDIIEELRRAGTDPFAEELFLGSLWRRCDIVWAMRTIGELAGIDATWVIDHHHHQNKASTEPSIDENRSK